MVQALERQNKPLVRTNILEGVSKIVPTRITQAIEDIPNEAVN